jgi:sulfur-carrier protein
VRVDFYGIYRPIAGSKTIEFELERGATIRDLLEAVVSRFPALRDELLDLQGQLYPWIPLTLNGRNPRLLGSGVDSVLQPGDVLSIFSPIASGKINVEDIKKQMTSPGEDVP